MATAATEVEGTQLAVPTPLSDWRGGWRIPYSHEHHGKHACFSERVASMAIHRVARKTSHEPPRRIDRAVGERRWRRLSDAIVPDRRDHLVAGHEVLAPQFAGQLARELSADQLGFA